MGFKASIMTAKRSLTRRKTKNLSAILAISLGVTLMVGIQITTDTMENSFLTSILQTEGEVDIQITNATTGGYFKAADEEKISPLVPDAIGIMSELTTRVPVMVGSQFEPSIELAGIPLDYPEVFGTFYNWQTGNKMDISTYLTDNSSILISSNLARKLNIEKEANFPVTLNTEFTNISVTMTINETSGLPIFTPSYTLEKVELSIVGVYDSNRPGIGSQYRGALFSLEHLQDWISLQDPTRQKDRIGTFLVSFKTDHFNSEIDEEYLQAQVDAATAAVPEQIDPLTGRTFKIYVVDSVRLVVFEIADMIFNLMSTMLSALGFLIITTGILLITNVQLMSVEDREFQTGVLRAVGEKRRGIFQSVLIETVFQGTLGGLFGLIGGYVFGQAVAMYLANMFGTGDFSIRPVIHPQVVIISVIAGVALGIVTGILPALRASRVNIVEALRGIKTTFEEKASRNLFVIGILFTLLGSIVLLNNGVLNDSTQGIWSRDGWDSMTEWRNILVGAGSLSIGFGIVFSRYISRTIAFNVTAISLWTIPVFLFVVAFGRDWITDVSGPSSSILIISIAEIIIGSVSLVGLNLTPLMRILRNTLIRIRGVKGVAQVAPAMISSHKTRSTLTFAIFAVVLTLNVTVATMVSTNFASTIVQSEEDSRGVDLIATLSRPEASLIDTSYSEELYKLDSNIEDVIGLKTFSTLTDISKFAALKDPYSMDFDPLADLLPLGYGELRPEQIRGTAVDSSDPNWRYDFYLSGLPDGVRQPFSLDIEDEEALDLSKQAWDLFFDPSYTMPAYNLTLGGFQGGGMGPGGDSGSEDALAESNILRDESGQIISNPIVFTDSFLIPLGLQVWIPMNTSTFGFPTYQAFTVGGSFDFIRAGGFPLSSTGFGDGGGDFGGGLGNFYLPYYWSEYTNFFGDADGITPLSRGPNQFDTFLIKTSYAIDDPEVDSIAQAIEKFTNTNDAGYRLLIDDNFILASSTSIYARIEASLAFMEQIISFLQIYVSFGLVIGAVGMGVISVRNVAERKREIGMMRAIGFPRSQVMLSALLELVVLGLIGLVIGVVNGLLINIGFANMQGVSLVIPWGELLSYLTFITVVALLAGAIPGWVASRIPAAEALRYVG